MSTRTPQSIAAHITTALIPAITTTAGQHGRHPGNLITRLQGCAINLTNIDMPAIAASLGREHHTAAAGRPRQGAGGNTGGIGTSTTEDISCELDRISRYWLDLTETIDRLHPHPDWPPITSGLRARLTTATEALIAVCVAPGATQDPQVAWEDLTDAVEGVQVATAAVMHAARRASRARAWAREHDLDDIDPPDTLTEAARCTGWPNGKDKAGEPLPIALIRQAIEEASDENGWAFLGSVGSYLNKIRPDFDPRLYGHRKLSDLLKHQPRHFAIEERVVAGSSNKMIYIRALG